VRKNGTREKKRGSNLRTLEKGQGKCTRKSDKAIEVSSGGKAGKKILPKELRNQRTEYIVSRWRGRGTLANEGKSER